MTITAALPRDADRPHQIRQSFLDGFQSYNTVRHESDSHTNGNRVVNPVCGGSLLGASSEAVRRCRPAKRSAGADQRSGPPVPSSDHLLTYLLTYLLATPQPLTT